MASQHLLQYRRRSASRPPRRAYRRRSPAFRCLNRSAPRRPCRLRPLCRSLEAHPERQTTLGDWSQRLGLSEKTLSRLFQRETGLSFRAWRQRLRLLGALAPLERGERVTDVALACGYDSTSAFIAAFRQQFGCTPGEFFRE